MLIQCIAYSLKFKLSSYISKSNELLQKLSFLHCGVSNKKKTRIMHLQCIQTNSLTHCCYTSNFIKLVVCLSADSVQRLLLHFHNLILKRI